MKHGAPRRKEISRFGRGLITALWTLGILLALLAGGAAYAGWRVSERDRTLPNQWLDGIAVGDLTQEEAASRLREAGWDSLNDLPLTVNFPLDLSLQLDRREARASYTAEEAAALIYSRGHGASRLENLRDYIQASLSRGVELRLEPGALNETYVRANIRSVTDRFRELTWDSELHLDAANARMSLTKGGGSIWLDDAKIYRAVSDRNLHEGLAAPQAYLYVLIDYDAILANSKIADPLQKTPLPSQTRDFASPVVRLSMARGDRVPYLASENADTADVTVWENVLTASGNRADLNEGVYLTEHAAASNPLAAFINGIDPSSTDLAAFASAMETGLAIDGALQDNRVYMFTHREDNSVKRGAEITGGFNRDTETFGYLYLVP